MARRMIRVEGEFFTRWVCSECDWKFNPSGPPIGTSLEEMKQNFVSKRDFEFESHVCGEHPRTPGEQGRKEKSKNNS
jgi:rubredoxin